MRLTGRAHTTTNKDLLQTTRNYHITGTGQTTTSENPTSTKEQFGATTIGLKQTTKNKDPPLTSEQHHIVVVHTTRVTGSKQTTTYADPVMTTEQYHTTSFINKHDTTTSITHEQTFASETFPMTSEQYHKTFSGFTDHIHTTTNKDLPLTSEQPTHTGHVQTTTNKDLPQTTKNSHTTGIGQTTTAGNQTSTKQQFGTLAIGLKQTTTNQEPQQTTEHYYTTQLSGFEQTTTKDPLLTAGQHTSTASSGHEETFPLTTKQPYTTFVEPIPKTTKDLPQITGKSSLGTKSREVAAWVLVVTFTILFTGSLTLNIIVLCMYNIKKRHKTETGGQAMEYELDNNPCYETSKVTHTAESEIQTNVYEAM